MALSSPDSVSIDFNPDRFRISVIGWDGFGGKFVNGSWVEGGFEVDDLKDFFKIVSDKDEAKRLSNEARAALPDAEVLSK